MGRALSQCGQVVKEPGAVATGSYVQPAIRIFAARKKRGTRFDCLDPVAIAPGSVTGLLLESLLNLEVGQEFQFDMTLDDYYGASLTYRRLAIS